MREGKYIYGIVASSKEGRFGSIGVGGREVYTIRYQDVAAVVSDSPIELIKEDALIHEHVIRKVMEDYTVIPVSFGTIARNEEEVKKILKRTYGEIKDVLKKIDHKIEIDVKALWNTNIIFKDILNEDREIRRLKEVIATKHPDQTYNDKIELGKMVKSALDREREEYIKEIQNALGELAEDSRPNKLTEERMIMNTSFLVDRNKEKEFYDRVDELEEKYGEKIELISVGPLPPYNFARIEVKEVDFETIDSARKVLGLGEEASMAEIKAAYHDLAYKYHPDRNPDPSAKEKFKKIEKAYSTLTDYCEHYLYSFRKPEVERTIMIINRG